jgi:hypothetical protein
MLNLCKQSTPPDTKQYATTKESASALQKYQKKQWNDTSDSSSAAGTCILRREESTGSDS